MLGAGGGGADKGGPVGWGGGVDLKGHEILKSPGQGVTEVTEFRRLASQAIGEPEAASSPHLCHSLSTRGQAEGARDHGDGRQERDLCSPRSPQAELVQPALQSCQSPQ